MPRSLNPSDFPADRVMRGEYLEALPQGEAADMLDEFRDRSLDEAEDTLREESEYWHNMLSEVGDEWFFQLED